MLSQILQSAETLIVYTYTNCKTVFQTRCLKGGDSEECSRLGCAYSLLEQKVTDFREAIGIFLLDCLESHRNKAFF
jgi:hypothetical protein